ncbi:hypothetical protein VTO42DRAFT_7040 [Malbranchea cinnamomea]
MPGEKEPSATSRKRKLSDDAELEIDLSAPEPPSKKALRKAKKKSAETQTKNPASVESGDEVQKPPKRTGFGIWIGNLNFSTTKEDLRTFLTTRGLFRHNQITRVHLPTSSEKRGGKVQNKGFAYVDFTTQDAVQQAIGLSEQELNGRRLLIKDANNFEGRPEKSTDKTEAIDKPPSRKIFVGNLAFDVTKEMLEEHFAPCGDITMVHVATFEDSGKCKGYAWVEFETMESAEAAVRGFVKVPDEEAMEESDAEESNEESEDESETKKTKKKKTKAKQKKVKEKKIWVNRLLGRSLRMEFAEDAATRYQKRFGKDAKSKRAPDQTVVNGEETADDAAAPNQEVLEKKTKQKPSKDKSAQRTRGKPEVQSHNRYSKETVQRLTGSIVEATGKKITFD